MAFEPKSDNHAIVEVVFGLTFARRFTATEIDALAKSHSRWRDDLPRLNRSTIVQFMMSDGPPPPDIQVPPPVGGITFDRIKPDGNLEWRLRADEQSLFVNCLLYSGWSDVWPRVRGYLSTASEIINLEENPIIAVLLQYIDVFEWAGKKESYQVDELFDLDSSLMVRSVTGKGHLWHLHQGWYRHENLPVDGRLLERVHIDGVEDGAGSPTVKIDTYMQLQMRHPQLVRNFFGKNDPADHVFGGLHDQNKALLRSVLNKGMAERIGLHASA